MASIIPWILANYQTVILDINVAIAALIPIFMLIPGEQPEKALKGIADFLAKFSNK